MLYGARGIGAGLGPIALRWILGQQPTRLRRTIGPAYFMVGVFYVALAWAPTLWMAALCVLCAHFGGSILWVFSTVLLQMEVPDRFRGRVFADRAGAGDADVVGVELLDRPAARSRRLVAAHARRSRSALMFCVPGVLWLLIQSRWQDDGTPEPARTASRREEVLERWMRMSDFRVHEFRRSKFSVQFFFNASIALCTSCFASSSCSSTSAMSIFGFPGNRSLRQ